LKLINDDTPLSDIKEQMKEKNCAVSFESVMNMWTDCKNRHMDLEENADMHDDVDNLVFLKKISSALATKLHKAGISNLSQLSEMKYDDIKSAKETTKLYNTTKESRIFGDSAFAALIKLMIDRNRCFADKSVDELKALYEAYCFFISQ
jgi:predicted flap endonuclease-1-like 5' DNA nuclease